MKITKWRKKDYIGLAMALIGLIGLILGAIYGAVWLLTNPNIPIIQKAIFCCVLMFVTGLIILGVGD